MGALSSQSRPAAGDRQSGGGGLGLARGPSGGLNGRNALWVIATLAGLVVWFALYRQLEPLSYALIALLPVDARSNAGEALRFFIFDAPKVLMLLTLVVFGMSFVRSYFSAERTRAMLSGRSEGVGNILAAMLGIFTPFCSCSAVSLFIGFVSAGVPLGVTFSFLVAAPMINEVALGLLVGLVGWKVAALYLGFGLTLAILSGFVIGKLKLEGWLEPWVRDLRTTPVDLPPEDLTLADRLQAGVEGVKEIVGRVWIWMIVGIAAGAFIHGYIPADAIAALMGRDTWWATPVAVLVGVPMYSNAAGVIPIVEALLGKGLPLGTVLAFMMSVIALSLPEAIILRKVLSLRLLGVFFAIVALGVLAIGYLFNALF